MEGPALSLSIDVLSQETYASNLDVALQKIGIVITGTGWASDLEYTARSLAKQRGVYSIAVLDHWVNYAERFNRSGKIVLPDELWVVDEYAMEIARQTFPGIPISLKQDLYANQQLKQVLPLSDVIYNELLYLLEPARSDWGYGEAGEFQALRYFFSHLPNLGLPDNTQIRLRSHPSDSPGKYNEFLSMEHTNSVILDTGSLPEALSRSKWVAGCQTYALTLALKAGRTVYGTLPPWAPPCVLPHKGLIHIKDFANS
jgi:hypothetical protein